MAELADARDSKSREASNLVRVRFSPCPPPFAEATGGKPFLGRSGRVVDGGMREWLIRLVLKTKRGVSPTGVQIPLPPPDYEVVK